MRSASALGAAAGGDTGAGMKLSFLLLHVTAASFLDGESDADVALRVGQKNIKAFQDQTALMIVAWQEACKIDKACSQADQAVLAQVYAYYTPTLNCRGNVAFNSVAPPTIARMITEGYDTSKSGYDLSGVPPKACFAHDTTVMAGGDLDFGIQDVEEEFSIVPGTGGKTIFVAASMTMGWRGEPLKRVKSIYRSACTYTSSAHVLAIHLP